MTTAPNATWSVFTKPWRTESLAELAATVRRMGFDGVELPVRPGYQVQPDQISAGLSEAVKILDGEGVTVISVATPPTESAFAACADTGVPVIRIMVPVSDQGYLATESIVKRQLDELGGLAQRYGVKIGVQPHYDDYISDSQDLYHLLKDFDPNQIGAIWDSAHDALARKMPEHGLELLWPWLLLVNFKNAYFERRDDHWQPVFVNGKEGMAQWDRALGYLRQRQYAGPLCLTAEYTDESDLESKVTDDLNYARSLMNGN